VFGVGKFTGGDRFLDGQPRELREDGVSPPIPESDEALALLQLLREVRLASFGETEMARERSHFVVAVHVETDTRVGIALERAMQA
jgi:hypothetical protein